MMKRNICIILLVFIVKYSRAQQSYIDSLRHEIIVTKNDTLRLILFGQLSNAFTEISPDSAYHYAEKMLTLAKELDLQLEEAHALAEMGYALLNLANYPRSLQTLLSGQSVAEDPKSEQNIIPESFPPTDEFTNREVSAHLQRLDRLSRIHQYLGILYGNAYNYQKALTHFLESRELAEQSGNKPILCIINGTLGRIYFSLKEIDSAWVTEKKAYDIAMEIGFERYTGSFLLNLGRFQEAKGNRNLAMEYFKKALEASNEQKYFRGVVATNLYLADLFRQSGNRDSDLYHINDALTVAKSLEAPDLLLRSYTAFADYYKTVNVNDSAVKYQSLIIKINDSLFNSKQVRQFQNIDYDEQQRQQQIEDAKSAYRIQFRMYALIAGIAIFLFIAIILWRNNLNKQKAYALLKKQKQETDKQKAKVEQTLSELKSTQTQLIQSEKMASLGELTAGIAHEIQNPLNFVNNFSEVNTELIAEMIEEIENKNFEEVKNIAKDIEENEQKIVTHGKRADAIVKGMLQHSRSSSGVKEPTDINALCDEYLRLSYHGLRAKDKSFNATTKTDYDESIGNINIIPQDIGRVILNLLTNAFYVVDEKKKSGIENYEPTVSISTKKIGDRVEIKVSDNGKGIPESVKEKIFQPFFTTKPTGQGTGLGLSLSYDIVKAHGGELKVETKEGEGSAFIIILPA